ncbi:ISL3 family transposase [Saccharothrix sp. NRRL B-16348]|uniref:ISL3 family transposase n=1 Tax=Saccharothrix sp. NRRL B-16348 TaxID=1415542 RepID=UPI0006AFEA9F|nr:ISL3 family transposase [Saccharothrix sp. NRRL B-16348]
MLVADLLAVMFPHLSVVRVEKVARAGGSVALHARPTSRTAACPCCGVDSARVHSRYPRTVSDMAVSGQETVLRLEVRRFFCRNELCERRIFAEQVDGLTVRYGRHSVQLRDVLVRLALALGGRPGARLCVGLASAVSRMTLLRLLRALPEPDVGRLRVVGVDEWAFRKGRNYGTILVDMATRRPVDLLPEATSDALAAWLLRHPGVEVVCRDRAGYFADGARRGAPDAIQVADRWHLLANLSAVVERVISRCRSCLRDKPDDKVRVLPTPEATSTPGPLAQRIRALQPQIQRMIAKGWTISAISRELNLDRKTVRRYARRDLDDLMSTATDRGSLIDAFVPYLRRRWGEGCVNAAVLYTEITAQGFRGSRQLVRRRIQHWRVAGVPAEPPPTVTPRKATGWIMRRPEELTDREQEHLDRILRRSDHVAVTGRLAAEFALLLRQRRGHELEAWVRQAETSDVTEMRGFATALRRDWDAVVAGLTLSHSNGPTEGNVNRLKLIKRAMFGRASFDLLRRRVLVTECVPEPISESTISACRKWHPCSSGGLVVLVEDAAQSFPSADIEAGDRCLVGDGWWQGV